MKRPALWVILVAVLLAGCASLPTSGPVEHYDQQHEQQEGGVEIAPEPPAPGASPLLIVEGFLHATATSQMDYQAARQYLTKEASAQWQPGSGIQVYEEGSPRLTGDDVVLETRLVGTVDPQGSFTASQADLVHDFGLTKQAGEWRISAPPPGVLVSAYLFRNSYRSAEVYYMSALEDALVPDAIIAPRAEQTPEAVMSLVFTGPSSWLAPAVLPTVPTDSDVAVADVRTDDAGVVEVELSGEVSSLNEEERTRLAAQLTWTLAGFGHMEGVRLRSGDTVVSVADADRTGVVTTSSVERFAPGSRVTSDQLFGLADNKIVKVDEESGKLRTTPSTWQHPGTAGLAVDAEAMTLAAVTTSDLTVGFLAGGERKARTGTEFVRPQFVRSGALWSYAAGGFQTWQDNISRAIAAPQLTAQKVTAFRVSPDGARVAVVMGTGSSSRLGVLRVVKTSTGLQLNGLRLVDLGQGRAPRDVGWRGASVLAISYDGGGTAGLVTSDVAGALVTDQNLPSSKPGATVAASSRLDGTDLIVCDGDGKCNRFVSDQRWITLSGVVRLPAYPS